VANDKDFKVKNGVKPTRYVEGLGTITAGTEGPSGLFSTTLYEGTAATQTITNGINLSSDGGLVWTKNRDGTDEPTIMDTVTGTGSYGNTNSTNQYGSTSNAYITAFNTNGYTLGLGNQLNRSGNSFVSWTWKKTANFFDVVSYTGDGNDGRTISHNLGSTPGMIIVARRDSTNYWRTWHRSQTGKYANLYDTGVFASDSASSGVFNNYSGNDSTFTAGININANSATYVAYLFGHNSSNIHCGSYTGNGSATGPTVTTGFKPQWIMVKGASQSSNWTVLDSTRGLTADTNKELFANLTNSEGSVGYFTPTDTGFTVRQATYYPNSSGETYIYVAIAETKDTDTLDLSTGSVFNYTPTASKTLKLGSPAASGTNTSATLLVNGNDAAGVTGNFSTTLYTGTGSSQTISNGIDLSGSNEGLVWIKRRDATEHNDLYDTVRGATKDLRTNATTAEGTETNGLQAFTSNGFTVGGDGLVGVNNGSYVAWTFKSTSKFFDIVQYTGNATTRTIAHNLGTTPGMIIVKKTSGTGAWYVFHRSSTDADGKIGLLLNSTDAQGDFGNVHWDVSEMSSTHFGLGNMGNLNGNGSTYIAYLFAHDTASDSLIQCGSYTGNGSATGPNITIGWQPQFIMIKRASGGSGDWDIYDTTRGIPDGAGEKRLEWNTNDAESTAGVDRVNVSSTGFSIATTNTNVNANGDTYVYMAIRAQDVPSTTYDSSIKFSGGTAPASPAIGETDVITLDTTDGGTNYYASLAIDGAK